MFKTFDNMEALMKAVDRDKNATGAGAFVANRYPVRFVLFDNFRDCYEFVSLQSNVFFKSIDLWLNPEYPDVIVTHSELATKIRKYAEDCSNDSVITPFSELARFFNNKTSNEFNSLISTIKSVESSKSNYEAHRRVYIPIVGLYGKMSRFTEDSQSTIWYLKSADHQLNYHLILTDGTTYGVQNLESKYTIVHNATEWLNIWKKQDIKQTIICTSHSIFANAEYAQPDNAFDYTTCHNVHDFLVKGLGLPLDIVEYEEVEDVFWRRLATEIDVNNFNLTAFFNSRFGIHELANFDVFYKIWFSEKDSYSRWLLSAYYTHRFCNEGYICSVLRECNNYSNPEFVQHLLLTIFDEGHSVDELEERNAGLRASVKQNITVPDNVQELLLQKIHEVEEKMGAKYAFQYLTLATEAEKSEIIKWLAAEKVGADDVRKVYPDLYSYMQPSFGTKDDTQMWSLSYMDNYKKAKIANYYTSEVNSTILEKNANEIAFNSWYNCFKTVRTLFNNRNDIQVYYWIDGLGIEWIPFISEIISERNLDHFFLNEVYIARATLPTVTDINKIELQKLAGGPLDKYGDLDSDSHRVRPYPSYIIDDMAKVREVINRILDENPGKKIAIVSDHGISYMSQLRSGLNLSGIKGHHGGRYATWNSGKAVSDEKYKILDDQNTICALRHESLTSKIDNGSGCHGGCTPEEVLVPVFIISDFEQRTNCTIAQKSLEVSASNPVMKFAINGLANKDIPYLVYNGKHYALHHESNEVYVSDNIDLVSGVEIVEVWVDGLGHPFHFKAKLGTEENDLFDDLF